MSSFEGSGRELPTSPPPPVPEPSSESSEATSPPPPSSPPPSGPPSEKRASDDSIGPPPDIDAEGNTSDTLAHALEPNEETPSPPPSPPKDSSIGPPPDIDAEGNTRDTPDRQESIGPPPDIDADGNTRDTPAHALESNEEMPPAPPPGPIKLDSAGNKKEPPIDLELNGLEPVTVHFLNNSYVFKQQKTNINQLTIVFLI